MNQNLKQFLQRWLITTVAVMVAASIIHGISYNSFATLLVASLILGILNAFLRPLLVFLALPLVIFTLGLFLFVINAILLYLVSLIVTGFHVNGFWPAFWGALVITIMTSILNTLTGAGNSRARFQFQRRPPPPPPPRDDGNGPVIDV